MEKILNYSLKMGIYSLKMGITDMEIRTIIYRNTQDYDRKCSSPPFLSRCPLSLELPPSYFFSPTPPSWNQTE